jgi:UDP:flavonoid glycosyltransferase YjiC (YdhE family)
MLPRRRYTPTIAAAALLELLHDENFEQCAREAARVIATEDGATAAVNMVETVLAALP